MSYVNVFVVSNFRVTPTYCKCKKCAYRFVFVVIKKTDASSLFILLPGCYVFCFVMTQSFILFFYLPVCNWYTNFSSSEN